MTKPAAHSDRPDFTASLPDEVVEEINRLWTVVRSFSSTAHDVNNALQVIAGNAELLEARDLDPAVRRRVETMRTEAARASTAINRLLQYSRENGAAGRAQDLWPFVEHAIGMRASSAGRRRVVLRGARSGGAPVLARFDGTRTLQAILDLLLAAEARVAGLRNASVDVTIEREGAVAALRVRASGDGEGGDIAGPSPLAAVSPAIGMPLWTAAHLAASQGGGLAVDEATAGCVYTLTLPAADA